MSGKDKLKKFRENETFSCLIQPSLEEVFEKDHPLKGRWNSEVFKNNNPIVLELGCGKGEYTIALSQMNKDINYIGVDIKGARLWKGAKYAHTNALANVAFLRTRIEFITSMFAPDEISQIWITFADPQPKNERKRLTHPLFLTRYQQFLKKEGTIHLKTDSDLLHQYTLETVRQNNLTLLESNDDIYGSGRADGILSVRTHYETAFLSQGIAIKYLAFTMTSTATEAQGLSRSKPEESTSKQEESQSKSEECTSKAEKSTSNPELPTPKNTPSTVAEPALLQRIIDLRHSIHMYPDLSGEESFTASRILSFLSQYRPDYTYYNIAGNGFIVRFDLQSSLFTERERIRESGSSSLLTEIIYNTVAQSGSIDSGENLNILFRCELDALAIEEKNDLQYRSKKPGIAHLCGHDGHIAILCHLAASLNTIRSLPCEERENSGSVTSLYLLFQPAEETGEGAALCLRDMIEQGIEIDYGYALHNAPGYETGAIITYSGTYAYASAGIEVLLTGRNSHAAEPHLALNPHKCITEIATLTDQINTHYQTSESSDTPPDTFLTIVHIELGSNNYGITPGEASIRITARSRQDETLNQVLEKISQATEKICRKGKIECRITYHDHFPAMINSSQCNRIIEKSATERGLKLISLCRSNPASDDFSHLARRWKCALFEVGNGLDSKKLHDNSYIFNDFLINILSE